MRLYLDGVEVGCTARTGSAATNPSVAVNIGRDPDGSNSWLARWTTSASTIGH